MFGMVMAFCYATHYPNTRVGNFWRFVQRITLVARVIGRNCLHADVIGSSSDNTSATRIDVGNNRCRGDALKNMDVTTDGSSSFRRKHGLRLKYLRRLKSMLLFGEM